MTLVEVMKKAEPGDVIERFKTNNDGELIPLGSEFVVLKNNKLKSLGDEYGALAVQDLCSDCWRIATDEF